MKTIPDYAVFILSNRRPDRVATYETLRKQGYSGPIYIIIDDEDPTRDEYKVRFGESVHVFDKKNAAKYTDAFDNNPELDSVLYARNACYRIAKKLELQCFVVLDDDYLNFAYKYDSNLCCREKNDLKSLDKIFEILIEFYYKTPAKSLAIAQGGDFIGGKKSRGATKLTLRRKCMNFWICDVDREVHFKGRMNDDVNTYIDGGNKGDLFFTVPQIMLHQQGTQQNEGGLTEMYLQSGTYIKSFYTVLTAPSCTRIKKMGARFKRWHHRISWNNAVPVILRESWRK